MRHCFNFFMLFSILVHHQLTGQPLLFAPAFDVSQGSVSGVSSLDVGDLNTDGLLDVVVMEGGAHSEGRTTFAWFEQISNKNWKLDLFK